MELFRDLVAESEGEGSTLFVSAVDWALRHQVVIERFGRFPSRNAALGRRSTAEERAFLEDVPTGF